MSPAKSTWPRTLPTVPNRPSAPLSSPVNAKLVPVATPMSGVVKAAEVMAGEFARTMLPDPVEAFPRAVTVPEAGKVRVVGAAAVKATEKAPAVLKDPPLAIDRVPVVVVIVRPLIEVAVAIPSDGVVSAMFVAARPLGSVVEACSVVPL